MQFDDVFAPSYREYGAQFVRGVKPRDVLMYWGGDERGNDFSGPAHDFAWCVPIGTQCLHAAGAALAFKLRGEPRVAVACVGDGGSSKTDTYAAINSAGAYTLPFVLCIINNQWAISVPRKSQTGAEDAGPERPRRRPGLPAGRRQRHHRGAGRDGRTRSSAPATATAARCWNWSPTDWPTTPPPTTPAATATTPRSKQAWEREPITRLRTYLITESLGSEQEGSRLEVKSADAWSTKR